ncbi:MAG TPA: hypothetical protein VN653_20125 [Anaerolineales bacterium]|nr:hypothetical protein [Anaerolineales bacterium]
MEPESNDEKVVQLLSKLKNADRGYPSDMLASRRQNYLKQVANIGAGIGLGTGIKHTAKNGNGAGATASITSKILESALVAAIAIEASTAAYLYRDKIADAVNAYLYSENIQHVAPPSDNVAATDIGATDPVAVEIVDPTYSLTSTPSGTPSVTPSGTLSQDLAGNNNSNTGISANSTPDPGGNNGNHFGQTPKPVRTKENNNDPDTGGGNKIKP